MNAFLFLEDGTTFDGEQFGALASTAGEVVFNTGMVGYPEAMTDPSYSGQILVFTYPLIGNYGIAATGNGLPSQEHLLRSSFESSRIQPQGIVVATHAREFSHWSGAVTLDSWMREKGIPGIAGIDTRALTKRLRERGTMLGKIVVGGNDVAWNDPNLRNLAAEVSIQGPESLIGGGKGRVILVDLGAKWNIIRNLLRVGFDVLRVPWNYDWTQIEADAVLVSNGPGDPKQCVETIDILRRGLASRDIPVTGICLGHQIIALAAGADTYKLKYGHRSQNQPCVEVGSKRCFITSQNHGYAVDERSLPDDWVPWFFNANDGTNEGMRHRSRPLMSVQFHPEAAPGPSDTRFFFDSLTRIVTHATSAA